jgi:hypothetical protein
MSAAPAPGGEPDAAGAFSASRRDLGDLVVLEVGGGYEEMGRQQAELLGDDLRRVFERQLRDHRRAVARGGLGARLLDAAGIPLWSAVGGAFEDSHFHEELAGMAAGLGVPRRDLMRALLALGGGSTVFAATRTATADGSALIGRNVDWDDLLGARRPLVVHYRPSNGDLEHLFAGWPLVGLPTVGVNEAGFALSFNYFVTDPQVGLLLPQWPHRRALQRARSVEEGVRIFLDARERGIATFMVMADAAGGLAMVECTPRRCAVFRPEGDWFGQANHARTPEMIPFDRYRSPDSSDRRAGMERAVERHLGRLTPALAAEILRDRSTHPWPNASNVANLAVLNAAVVHPASRTLWHSTAMQPAAPFGEYAGFTLGGAEPTPRTLPASPRLGSAGLAREAASVAAARTALHALYDGRPGEARAGFDALLAETPPVLDPARLAVGAAHARFDLGDAAGAESALAPALVEEAPVDVRIAARSLRALCADRLGRRAEAVELHRSVLALVESHPEWNEFAGLAELSREGLERSLADRDPAHSYYVLRIPF